MRLPLGPDEVAALVAQAEAKVVEWAVLAPLAHRREPWRYERLWHPRSDSVRGGLDSEGNVVVVARADSRPSEVVIGNEIAFLKGDHSGVWELIRYEYDGPRLVRTEYLEGEETYEYDGHQVARIEEFDAIWCSTTEPSNARADVIDCGGRIEVGDGLLTRGDEVVWRAGAAPFAELVARAVPGCADRCVEAIAGWASAEMPVDTLWLDNRTQHDLYAFLHVGSPDRRKRWEFFDGPDEPVSFDDAELTLLREGSLAGEYPPQVVAAAVARELLTRDWTGVLNVTEDFVVLVGESLTFDVPESLRQLNAPEIAARWLRS